MPNATPEQSQTSMMWFMVILLIGFVLVDIGRAVVTLSGPVGNDPTDPVIKRSAAFFPFWCLLAGASLLFVQPGKVPSDRLFRATTRISWACACVLCLLHSAIAFHLGHAWSHENAWEHTRQVGGYGDGIFVNYAFALVWLADALWLCVASGSYFARPRWLRWTVYGFLAFVVFNATVVFGSWTTRRAFFVWCVLLALMASLAALVIWVERRRKAEADEQRKNL